MHEEGINGIKKSMKPDPNVLIFSENAWELHILSHNNGESQLQIGHLANRWMRGTLAFLNTAEGITGSIILSSSSSLPTHNAIMVRN